MILEKGSKHVIYGNLRNKKSPAGSSNRGLYILHFG